MLAICVRSLLHASAATDSLTFTSLEPKNDSAVVPEVALVVVATSECISEASQHKIKLCRPDRDRLGQRHVQSSANDEVPSVVAGISDRCTNACARFLHVAVSIGVGSAKEHLNERFEMLGVAIFEDRPNVIGKQVAAGPHGAADRAGTVGNCREIEGPRKAGIPLKVPFDSKKVIEVNGHPSSPTV